MTIVIVDRGRANWADWCELRLNARVRKRDKMEGMASSPIITKYVPANLHKAVRQLDPLW